MTWFARDVVYKRLVREMRDDETRGTQPKCSGQRTVSKMLDNARMTIVSRSHQHSVRHLPAIIRNRIPRERGHPTIRFLHDQIGRRKVPVAALPAGESRVKAALRDPAQPQRQ